MTRFANPSHFNERQSDPRKHSMNTATTSRHRATVIAALVLLAMMVLGACGDDDDTAEPTVEPTAVPTSTAEPTVEPTAVPTSTAEPTVSVTGFVVDDGDRVRLCEALAESFPPQCGGTSYDLIDLDLGSLTTTTAEGVTWTGQPVTITGTIDSTTLTVIDVDE